MTPNRPILKMIAAACALACGAASAQPAAARTEAVERARSAALAAQNAALAALKAAEDAVAASDPTLRDAAVQRALAAAADANDAATRAQLAATTLQAASSAPAPSAPAPAPQAPAKPADPPATGITLADAAVTGTIKAGQADDTASITLTWSSETLQKAVGTSITFSAPTSSDGKPTRLGTLDGLSDAASIKLATVHRFPVDLMHPDEQFWTIGASGKVGRKDYSYIDAMAFKQSDATKTVMSAALFAGYVPNNSLMLTAKAEVQRKYKEGDETVFCRPVYGGSIECLNGAAGAPPRTTAKIVTLGSRYLGNGFALGPTISYDWSSKVRGVDLPLYFLGAGDGKPGRLSGGVGASWRSDTRDTALYVFVGSPFSFWAAQ